MDLDCGVAENPDLGTDICAVRHKETNGFGEDLEKPSSYVLTLGPLSETLVTGDTTGTVDGKVEIGAIGGTDDGDGSYYVVVSRDSDPARTDALFFTGTVAEGESFTAGDGSLSFGSETFVHIYSAEGGSLLQTINFHTSCSSPLIIGDQYGSITLAGASLEGKDSGSFYGFGVTETPGDSGVVYEITGGADAALFTVDPDTGEVSFIDPPDFETPGDADGNNSYDVEVTAFFTDADGVKTGEICEVKPIEVCVEDEPGDEPLCIDENTTFVTDLDLTVTCPVPTDIGTDLCMEREALRDSGVDASKPVELTLSLNDLTTAVSSNQNDKLKVGSINGTDDGDGDYFVRVSKNSNPTDLGDIYFSGDVSVGDSFSFASAAAGRSEFGSETFVHIFDDDGEFLQTIGLHTSCSAPLVIGEKYASITLEAGALRDKGTGDLIEFGGTTDVVVGEGDIVYSIAGGADADFFRVDPDTGEVSFINPPDFETPLDDGADNVYDVVIRATAKSDPTCFTDAPVQFCVEDVLEVGSLSGRYFCDENDNDVDDGEPGVAGVLVELLDAAGVPTGVSTTTAADGSYSFAGLAPGTYGVRFTDTVSGKVLVTPDQGGNDAIDSDAVQVGDPADGVSEITGIVVTAGADTPDNDAGVEDPGTAAITGRYFCDDNANDVDDGEPGIADAEVKLLDAAGNVVATTTTDGTGNYAFTGLQAGTYAVMFAAEATGKTFVARDDPDGNGDDTNDSDVDGTGTTGPITVGIGEVSEDNDAGVEDPGTASLAGRVFCDENDNSVDDAEPGIGGVTVVLLDGGGAVLASTTTGADGAYEFTGLKAGDYKVRFPTVIDGKVLVEANAGLDDTIDSDAGEDDGVTGTISLAIGQRSEDNDAGVEDPGTAQVGDWCSSTRTATASTTRARVSSPGSPSSCSMRPAAWSPPRSRTRRGSTASSASTPAPTGSASSNRTASTSPPRGPRRTTRSTTTAMPTSSPA